MTISRSVIGDNVATGSGNGAGIENSAAGGGTPITSIDNSLLFGNSASGSGGAIDIPFGSVSLTNSTVVANTAGSSGGGIRVGAGTTLTATNDTFAANVAGTTGGGIGVSSNSTTLTQATVSLPETPPLNLAVACTPTAQHHR